MAHRLPGLVGLAALVATLAVTPAAAGDVELTIGDGRVTIRARDASVKEILAEWSRVGDTAIIDADQLTDERVTLELVEVPEAQALRTLLRAAAGYLAAPRASADAGASRFDRILIMATSRPAPRAGAAAGRVPSPIGAAQRLGVVPTGQGSRPPVAMTPEQQEQLSQLQSLLQQPDADRDEPREEPAAIFGSAPTARPGEVMDGGNGATPAGIPTGVFGSTASETSDRPAVVIPSR